MVTTSVKIKLMNENFSYSCSELTFVAERALSDYYKCRDHVIEVEFYLYILSVICSMLMRKQ